jgi:hypothetical protein
MDVRFRPLVWTGPRTPEHKKNPSKFSANWTQTLKLLEGELEKIRATEIIIEADFTEAQLRLDGWPRQDARPTFQGVKISFNQHGVGRVEYATDVYSTWQHNVRAIAVGLAALRAVDRYGITAGHQQYTGFRAIEAAASNTFATKGAAARWIANLFTDETQRDRVFAVLTNVNAHLSSEQKSVLRSAMFKVHPDHGGSAEMMALLAEAEKALGPRE